MRSTLVLNASYEPLSIVPAKRAVALLLNGKIVPLDPSPVDFAHAGGTINVPYVALRTEQVRRGSSRRKGAGYTHRGVLVRDGYTCQFCGKYGDTIDHIVPQSKGGATSYENCVAACLSCNGKKGNKTLKEMGWTLARTPRVPSEYETLLQRVRNDSEAYAIWSQYVGWWSRPGAALTPTPAPA